MKRGRLPLTALRSFEAAGRQLSFSGAAAELYVSQAAISRQIRELETIVGKPLFDRLHRRVVLTEPGRQLLAQLTRSFDDIDLVLSDIIAETGPAALKVSVEPSFAGALLIPRLHQFQTSHPDVDVSVDADMRLVEFRNHEAEIAIRYSASAKSWPRTQARHLYDVRLTPVLTPELLASAGPLVSPADLRHFTLLHDSSRDAWARWFVAAGLPDMAQQRGPIFPDSSLIMQAARLGHGVALGDGLMERDDLSAGTLVRPFDTEVPFGAYWLVAADFDRLSPQATAFALWVMDFTARPTGQG